jgi:type IV secretion system protein VirB10
MRQQSGIKFLPILFLGLFCSTVRIAAQEQPTPPPSAPATNAPQPAEVVPAAPAAAQEEKIVLPAGTHLPLVMSNGINTRTAKAGDAVYFQTVYPIAQNNRMVIPMGTFVRGRITSAKRPGFVKGRGEFRMVLDQLTFPNGYTITLTATPNSADTNGRAGVDSEGTIKGPANVKSDVGMVVATTVGGAYIGTLAGAINSSAPGRGAAIGGGAGLLVGLAVVLLTRGPEAELSRGTTLDVVFDRPLVLDAAFLPASDAGNYSPPPIPPVRETDARRKSRARRPLLFPPLLPFLRF